ncbi:MAG TPA: hypothetical protein VFL80_01905, partial [Thermoanaerobaculia bacterium]|nr:hypothetical protein [Thermoanaerobaculia bacterium]
MIMTALLALAINTASIDKLQAELVAKYGEAQKPRIERGLRQVSQFWRAEDGDDAAFADFVQANFAGDPATLDALFNRLQWGFESLDGHMLEINRDWRRHSDLDLGPILPFDEVMAGYDPSAHLNDDLFANKLAFVVLLNFPLTTLEERLGQGDKWTRRQWAEAKLALRFSRRVPAEVSLALGKAGAEASQFVSTYNIWMHHVLDQQGRRLFPPKMRLLEHWNLRDEIKANYSEPKEGLAKQRAIQRVMERIVDQTIPNEVVDNPKVDWNPYSNAVQPAAVQDAPDHDPQARIKEANSRYATILKTFRAAKLVDPYSPTAPTLIDRRFNEDRQIPEQRVKAMLEAVLSSPMVPRVAKLIEKRLGRPLEPFDIWYNGFRPRGKYTEAELDAITRKRYPTADAYKADMPNLLVKLGFSPERAKYLADNIMVDAARGSGHAYPAGRRADFPRLRTRVGKEGMDY